MMNSTLQKMLTGLCLLGILENTQAQRNEPLSSWLTDPDRNVYFKRQEEHPLFIKQALDKGKPSITVDEKQRSQTMDGFGWALTGGSATQIIRMSPGTRAALLKELFATTENNIGGSYLRISIGASDLNEKVFSYDDLPAGQVDTALHQFDLGPDRRDVIPVLKEILAINPLIKVLGSPWSPPAWMKTNNDTRGGSLKPEYYGVYAHYLVRYIREMKKEGIRIDAITVQNEPLHPGNNPSLLMPAAEQGAFVKNFLGPAFRRAKLDTKIIIYDHNADRPDYPISILKDPAAAKYIDGSAFHLYAGKIEALSEVHHAFPGKNLYFTEQWVGAPGNPGDIREHIQKLIIGATRNWSRNVVEWNLASDPAYKPHTDRGGCDRCLGALTIDGDKVTRNPAYYIIAHAAKLVRPGSVRIGSETNAEGEGLPNTAFRTPAGRTVLIVLNNTAAPRDFSILFNGKSARTRLPAGAVATYQW